VREEKKERSEFDDQRNFSLTLSSLSADNDRHSNSLFLFADKPLLNRNLMFDFEKLVVYQRSKTFHLEITRWLVSNQVVDSVTRDQLRRASLTIALNIAEGSGRFSQKDRGNFFVVARSSVFEVAAIFDILKDASRIAQPDFEKFYLEADELSRILFTLIKKLEVS
jgi:four helix bundle protein